MPRRRGEREEALTVHIGNTEGDVTSGVFYPHLNLLSQALSLSLKPIVSARFIFQ